MNIIKVATDPNIISRESNSYKLDIECWKRLCRENSPMRILELGTGEGLFLSSIMPLLLNSEAVTINAPLQKKTEGNYVTFDTPSREKIGRMFRGEDYESRIRQVFCLTKDMMSHIGGEKFDLIHIDASHDKKDVIMDSMNAMNLINEGGLIVWHDFHPDRCEPWIVDVYDAIEYFCNKRSIDNVFWFDRSWVCYTVVGGR